MIAMFWRHNNKEYTIYSHFDDKVKCGEKIKLREELELKTIPFFRTEKKSMAEFKKSMGFDANTEDSIAIGEVTLLNFPTHGKRLEDVISITACTERSGACGCQVVDFQASGRRYLKHLKLSNHLRGGIFQTLTAKMIYNRQRHFVRRNRLLRYCLPDKCVWTSRVGKFNYITIKL